MTIGARSRIAGNVWLHRDVPPDTLVEAGAVTRRVIGAGGDDRVG